MAASLIVTVVLQIIAWVFQWINASDEKLKWFADIVQKNKDAGNVSAETAAKLMGYHADMRAEYAAKKKEKK